MNTPSIRFKGFSEDWEQRKLVEITTKIGSGKTPRGGSEAYVDEGIPLIRSQNVHDDMVDLSDVVFIDEETNKSMENSLVEYNDVLLNITGASIGRSAVYKSSEAANVNQHVCIIRPIEDYSSTFIQMNITSGNGQKQIDSSQAGGAREGLNFQQIGKMAFAFPSIQEQNKLGTYFSNLNNLITLHQRKCDSLKQVKKYMLQKMFPKQGEKVPELRFAGFTGDWEKRKLGEVSDKVTQKNQNAVINEVFTNSAEFGIISQRDFFDKDIANAENIEGYYVVEPDDFVYNPRISTTAPFGPIKRNKLGRTGAMSPLYYVFRLHDIDLSYLEWFFQTTCWHAFMRINGNSGARADRFAITDGVFAEMPICIPQDIEEQRKIGEYFNNIDNLITLHQRKCDSLKEIKKFMLQNMFPRG